MQHAYFKKTLQALKEASFKMNDLTISKKKLMLANQVWKI